MVEIDGEEYKKGVQELIYSVIGKFSLQKGYEAPTIKELKKNYLKFGELRT